MNKGMRVGYAREAFGVVSPSSSCLTFCHFPTMGGLELSPSPKLDAHLKKIFSQAVLALPEVPVWQAYQPFPQSLVCKKSPPGCPNGLCCFKGSEFG